MHIDFDTKDITAKEAAGLAALLVTLHGSAVLAALENVDFGRTVTVNNHVSGPEGLAGHVAAELRRMAGGDPRAADGYPQPEANAAEAFGEAVPTPPSDGVLDSAGTPWDERIHSGSRGTNKDGTWTRRRNTPDETFDTVMAELKARGGAPVDPTLSAVAAPPATPTSAPPASTPVDGAPSPSSSGPSATTAASPSEAVAPPPPPPAAPAAPPAPPASAAAITFPTLMVKITKAQGAGQIDKATVDGFIKELGASSMAQLARQPDKLAELNALVDATLGG